MSQPRNLAKNVKIEQNVQLMLENGRMTLKVPLGELVIPSGVNLENLNQKISKDVKHSVLCELHDCFALNLKLPMRNLIAEKLKGETHVLINVKDIPTLNFLKKEIDDTHGIQMRDKIIQLEASSRNSSTLSPSTTSSTPPIATKPTKNTPSESSESNPSKKKSKRKKQKKVQGVDLVSDAKDQYFEPSKQAFFVHAIDYCDQKSKDETNKERHMYEHYKTFFCDQHKDFIGGKLTEENFKEIQRNFTEIEEKNAKPNRSKWKLPPSTLCADQTQKILTTLENNREKRKIKKQNKKNRRKNAGANSESLPSKNLNPTTPTSVASSSSTLFSTTTNSPSTLGVTQKKSNDANLSP